MNLNIKSGTKRLCNTITLNTAVFIVLFIISFSLALLIIIIRQTFYHTENVFDQKVFSYLNRYTNNRNTVIMQWFSFLGSHYFLIPASLVLFYSLSVVYKNKWKLIMAVSIIITNLLIMFGLKFFFKRPRPLLPLLKEVNGLSFPSGHAFMSVTFFGLLIYFIYCEVSNKWLKWITIIGLAILIFTVGLSRVYLRVHYAGDVIAGFCFGILSIIILLSIMRQVEIININNVNRRNNI
jgi:membrane-associated phospholipid phosphatase